MSISSVTRALCYLSTLRPTPIFSKRSIHIHDGNAIVRSQIQCRRAERTHTDCRSRFSLLCCLQLQRQPILHYPTRASTINLFITFLYPFLFYWMRTQNDAIIDKCCCCVFHPRGVCGWLGWVSPAEWHSPTTTIRQCVCLAYRMQTANSHIICNDTSAAADIDPLVLWSILFHFIVSITRRHVGVCVCEFDMWRVRVCGRR